MYNSLCDADCSKCDIKETCNGCRETNGRPFGKECILVSCSRQKGLEDCHSCDMASCGMKAQLIKEFNSLNIVDMPEITDLNVLQGSFINLTYTLPGGQEIKIWDDDTMYLGNQVERRGSDRCYGLAADDEYLMVCEYGEGGANAEIIVFKKRDRS